MKLQTISSYPEVWHIACNRYHQNGEDAPNSSKGTKTMIALTTYSPTGDQVLTKLCDTPRAAFEAGYAHIIKNGYECVFYAVPSDRHGTTLEGSGTFIGRSNDFGPLNPESRAVFTAVIDRAIEASSLRFAFRFQPG